MKKLVEKAIGYGGWNIYVFQIKQRMQHKK